MSAFLAAKQTSYRAQRGVSQGAGITLVATVGEYVAHFDCAKRIAGILGNRELEHLEGIPRYRIPIEQMPSALARLSERYSIALVDMTVDSVASRFVLVYRINPSTVATPSDNPEDY